MTPVARLRGLIARVFGPRVVTLQREELRALREAYHATRGRIAVLQEQLAHAEKAGRELLGKNARLRARLKHAATKQTSAKR